MFSAMKKRKKLSLFLGIIFIIGMITAVKVFAGPSASQYFLNIEVNAENGAHIKVSTPLTMINTLYNFAPMEIRDRCQELDFNPNELVNALAVSNGYELIHVNGDDEVRIWSEAIPLERSFELAFIKISVKEPENGINLTIWAPKVILQAAGQIVMHLGLLDGYVELPPEFQDFKNLAISL